jgi:hypothetical protein
MASEKQQRIDSRKAFINDLTREELIARITGEFFTPLEFVWSMHGETIEDGWYNSMLRSPEQGRRLYEATVSNENLEHPMSPSCPSSKTNTNQREERFDMFENYTADTAHLISDAPACHKAYGFIAEAATGKQMIDSEGRLKLLNGVRLAGAEVGFATAA